MIIVMMMIVIMMMMMVMTIKSKQKLFGTSILTCLGFPSKSTCHLPGECICVLIISSKFHRDLELCTAKNDEDKWLTPSNNPLVPMHNTGNVQKQ